MRRVLVAYLIRPDSTKCRELGLSHLSHIPGIWSKDWKPIVPAFDFLIAKGTGRWVAGLECSPYAEQIALSDNTMMAVGYDLTNFIDWLEAQDFDWETAGAKRLLAGYRKVLSTGGWSDRRLASSTIKRRINTASEFLRYVRAPIEPHPHFVPITGREESPVPPDQAISNSSGRNYRAPGRQQPARLRLPTIVELEDWLDELRRLHGITPHLLAKSIFGLGLRAEEALLLRKDQVPNFPTKPTPSVKMDICFGTKGQRIPGDPEKQGKARSIQIPIALLNELHSYMNVHRKLCLKRYKYINPGTQPPRELFLSKHTGAPLSYSRFYELWRKPQAPFEHFSPHIGRHSWACYTLIDKLKEVAALTHQGDETLAAISANLGESLIDIWVKPQLGHVDSKTTSLYLRWVADAFDQASLESSWFDFLDG